MTETALSLFAFLLLPALGIVPNFGISPTALVAPDPAAEAARFETVSEQLDKGGVLYAYVSVDGDLAAIGEWVEGLLDQIRKANPRDVPFPVDVSALLQISGLDAVSAAGFSSKRIENGFRNKTYLLTPKGRKGFLRLFGGKPKPFEVVDMAPAGTEIAVEQDLNLKVAYEVVQQAFGVVMGDNRKSMVQAMVKQPLPPFTFTLERILADLDTQVAVIIDADPDKKLKIPDEEVEIPYLDAAVLVDGLGWIADEMVLTIEKVRAEGAGRAPPFQVLRDANWVGLQLEEKLPEDFAVYKPVLLHHRPSGKLVLATGKNFAEKLFIPKPNLRDDPDFRKTMQGLPTEGTAVSYFSPAVFRLLRETFENVIKTAPGPNEAAIATSVLNLILPINARGEGSVTTNSRGGVLTVSNSAHSHKSNLLSVGLMGPMTMGVASAMPFFMLGRVNQDFEEAIAIPLEHDHKVIDIEAERPVRPKVRRDFEKKGD
jgi:hypothetical protein